MGLFGDSDSNDDSSDSLLDEEGFLSSQTAEEYDLDKVVVDLSNNAAAVGGTGQDQSASNTSLDQNRNVLLAQLIVNTHRQNELLERQNTILEKLAKE